jgi:hypothetical protein
MRVMKFSKNALWYRSANLTIHLLWIEPLGRDGGVTCSDARHSHPDCRAVLIQIVAL